MGAVHGGGMKGGSNLDEVEDDSTIYWKVEALDRFGFSASCEPEEGWSFHVFVEQPPSSFDLLSPAHGDTLDSLTAELIWEPSSDPDPGDSVAFYRVYLAFDSLFTAGLDSQGVTAAELLWDGLADDQVCWWRVKAFDTFGASTLSNQTWNFYAYFCEIPLSFSLLEPADSSQLPFGEVNFCWQAARDPDPADTVNYMLCFVAGEIAFAIPVGLDTCGIVDVGALELPDTLIEWWVTAHSVCPDDTIESTSHFHFYPPSAVSGEQVSLPKEFALHPNFPNPFNPVTVIRYDVKERGFVSVEVFDLLGRKVATLVHGAIPAGFHAVTWNASNLPSGLYFCRMETAGFAQTRKLVLVK